MQLLKPYCSPFHSNLIGQKLISYWLFLYYYVTMVTKLPMISTFKYLNRQLSDLHMLR